MLGLSPSQTFALQLGLGIVTGLLFIAWYAYQKDPHRIGAWLDVALGGFLGGIIGGRLVHAAYSLNYFSEYPQDIIRVWHGGLDWHGAVLGAAAAAYAVAVIRNISFYRWSDAAAFAVPFIVMAGWWACREAGCAFGISGDAVRSVPGVLTGFLPNSVGDIAERLELQLLGMIGSVLIQVVVVWLYWFDLVPGRRLWIALGLSGGLMYGLSFWRGADANLREDRMLDLTIAVGSILIALWLSRRPPSIQNTSGGNVLSEPPLNIDLKPSTNPDKIINDSGTVNDNDFTDWWSFIKQTLP